MDATGYGDLRARREATIWQQMNHVLRVLLFVAAWQRTKKKEQIDGGTKTFARMCGKTQNSKSGRRKKE